MSGACNLWNGVRARSTSDDQRSPITGKAIISFESDPRSSQGCLTINMAMLWKSGCLVKLKLSEGLPKASGAVRSCIAVGMRYVPL